MPNSVANPPTAAIDDSCRSGACHPVISGVEVKREGRVEPFLRAQPMLSSAAVRWGEQTYDEMMVGFFDVAVDSTLDKPRFFQRGGSPTPKK